MKEIIDTANGKEEIEITDEYRDQLVAQSNANLDACRDSYNFIMGTATQDDLRTRTQAAWDKAEKAAMTICERPLYSNMVLAVAHEELKAAKLNLYELLDAQARHDKIKEIVAIINIYDLTKDEDLRRLEAHIRKNLIIREIITFADFLHGGVFASSSGKWSHNLAGYITQTREENDALTALWKKLVRTCHIYIGAASVLGMANSRLIAGFAYADNGDGPSPYDYTLAALIRAVPKEYQKKLDICEKVNKANQGLAAIMQSMPNSKRPKTISWEVATMIFYPTLKAPDYSPEEIAKGADNFRRNCQRWIKAGVAGRTKLPITWDDLANIKTWTAWVDAYNIQCRKAVIISERAGKVKAERKRRRSPTT